MRRVLVTGASGFIGRPCLERLLKRGFDVHIVSRSVGACPGVASHTTDLLDAQATEELVRRLRPSHLLHLAWYVEGDFYDSPENLKWLDAGARLFACFARNGGVRAVAAGTCAEYERSEGEADELLTPIRPETLYGSCKASLSLVARPLLATLKEGYTWGRVFFLYGPHEKTDRLIPSLIRAFVKKTAVPVVRGANIRDFLHVEDAAEAFVTLVEGSARGPVNICSGRAVSIDEIAGIIAAKFGMTWSRHTPGDKGNKIAGNVRRLKETGWAQKISLEDGLSSTIDWWKHREGLPV